jgi:phospholipase D1/2
MLGLSSKATTRVTKWAMLAVLVAIVSTVVYVLDPADQSPKDIVRQFRSFLSSVPFPFLVFALFIGVGSLALIPINILLVAAALIFPGWKGFFCGLIGALIASLLEYLVGRYLLDFETIEQRFGSKYRLIRQRISENGLAAMTFLSLVPIAPHIVNNIIAGVCRIKIHHLLIGTTIGFIPGLLVINILGRSVRKFVANPNWLTAGLVVAVLIAMFVIGFFIRKHLARKHEIDELSSVH